jgi:hypothetical protein
MMSRNPTEFEKAIREGNYEKYKRLEREEKEEIERLKEERVRKETAEQIKKELDVLEKFGTIKILPQNKQDWENFWKRYGVEK